MSDELYIDIETVPGQSDEVKAQVAAEIEAEIADLQAPSNYGAEAADKWHTKKAAEITEKAEEKWLKTAFNGARGEILSAAFAVGDGPVLSLTRRLGESERELLAAMYDGLMIELPGKTRKVVGKVVGHNVLGFDLRFLYHRCVILGFRPPIALPHDVSPSDSRVYDTMTKWAGWGQRISQDNLCRALGLPTKPGMTGADVYPYAIEGRYKEIADYNEYDVGTVRAIHKRMTFA